MSITGYTIVVENYLEYTSETESLFVIHALDSNNVIIDFAQFTDTIQSKEAEIFQMFGACNLSRIIVSVLYHAWTSLILHYYYYDHVIIIANRV